MITLAQHCFDVSSFCGPNAIGNRHRVLIFDEEAAYLESQKNYHEYTQEGIYVFLLLTGSDRVKLCFYQNSHPIMRCGSGTLAAMAALKSLNPEHHYQYLVSDIETIQLIINSPPAQQDYFFYSTQSSMLRSTLAAQYACVLGTKSGRVDCWLESQEEKGYLIAVLESEGAVGNAQPELHALCQLSQRALIITAPAKHSCNFVLRYFAPQYGNNEDQATGSANVVVAPYWFKRLKLRELTSRQLSQNGGLFTLRLDQPHKREDFTNTANTTSTEKLAPLTNDPHIPATPVQIGGQCIVHRQLK